MPRPTGWFRRHWKAVSSALRRLLHIGSATDSWEETWALRQRALERLYGRSSEHVLHAVVPFDLGGQADVLIFPEHIVGATLYVTADLTGEDSAQISNGVWDQYELAICVRGQSDWPPNTISRLATYCVSTPLRPGETMDIGPAVPQPCAIEAFVFEQYGSFRLQGKICGVLLCIGITGEELQTSFELGSTVVIEQLRGEGIFPFTDLSRVTSGGGAA